MKKVFMLIGLMVAMASCTSKQPTTVDNFMDSDSIVEVVDTVDVVATDTVVINIAE